MRDRELRALIKDTIEQQNRINDRLQKDLDEMKSLLIGVKGFGYSENNPATYSMLAGLRELERFRDIVEKHLNLKAVCNYCGQRIKSKNKDKTKK